MVDPVGCVRAEAARKDGRTILQRNRKDARSALGREPEFVANGVGEQFVWRCPGFAAGDANDPGRVVLNGRDHFLLYRIPPLIRENAVAVGIGTREKGSVAGRGARVGISVIAAIEVRTAIDKQPESIGDQLVMRAFEIVTAELVYDNDHHQFGLRVVSGSGKHRAVEENSEQKRSNAISHRYE